MVGYVIKRVRTQFSLIIVHIPSYSIFYVTFEIYKSLLWSKIKYVVWKLGWLHCVGASLVGGWWLKGLKILIRVLILTNWETQPVWVDLVSLNYIFSSSASICLEPYMHMDPNSWRMYYINFYIYRWIRRQMGARADRSIGVVPMISF